MAQAIAEQNPPTKAAPTRAAHIANNLFKQRDDAERQPSIGRIALWNRDEAGGNDVHLRLRLRQRSRLQLSDNVVVLLVSHLRSG